MSLNMVYIRHTVMKALYKVCNHYVHAYVIRINKRRMCFSFYKISNYLIQPFENYSYFWGKENKILK